ncbi:MAG: sulfatase-like hydrolase/transferase [bacterium]|nr:sulfatase-like hydrolase/transferase [bacterium]
MLKKSDKRSVRRLYLLLLPMIVFYYELIFNLFTVNTLLSRRIIYILLFSIVCGGIGTWFCSLLTKGTPHKFVKTILIFGVSIPFLVEYFVYKQFKIFYDLHTITAGAGDAVSGFKSQIVEMITSAQGMLAIVLFLLPTFLYAIWLQRYDPVKYTRKHYRIILMLSVIVIFLVSIIGIGLDPACRRIYGKQYNFQEAVSNFGLLTGIRKEIQKNILGLDDEFEAVSSDEMTAEEKEELEPEEIVYDDNVMEIDFAALAANSSGTLQSLDNYVASLTPSKQNEYTGLFEGKNLIFITAEAFTAEVIDPQLTPTLYRLETKGIHFTDYYQPASAGTTGGEYQNVFGMLPMYGGSSFKMTVDDNNYLVMGNQLNRLGYSGWAFHNNSFTYYDRNVTHNNLGYSNGFMGYGNGMETYVTEQWPQSDLEMVEGTLPLYIDAQPFNVYYMSVSGHSGYSYNGNAMTKKNWSSVENLPYSDQVKGYLAANLELENALTYMVTALEEAGIADDTVIVISSDHFPYGIDENGSLGNMPYLSELYGYNVTDYFQRDHNRLIIWSGCLEEKEPVIVDTPTFSLDILPTLSNLFGVEFDSRLLPGRDVFSDAMPLVYNTSYDWKTDLGTYYASSATFVPVDESVEIPENYVETISSIVRNKINYCNSVLETNYFNHVFGN